MNFLVLKAIGLMDKCDKIIPKDLIKKFYTEKWKEILGTLAGSLKVKMTLPLKVNFRLNVISIKILMVFFIELEQIILWQQ